MTLIDPGNLLGGLIAKVLNSPLDQGKVLFWLLAHIGFGYAYHSVKTATNRLLYGLIIGTVFSLSMFGRGTPS